MKKFKTIAGIIIGVASALVIANEILTQQLDQEAQRVRDIETRANEHDRQMSALRYASDKIQEKIANGDYNGAGGSMYECMEEDREKFKREYLAF